MGTFKSQFHLTLGGIAAAVIVYVVGLLAGQAPAQAAFPGANGKIAFVSDRDGNTEIYAMNADGSDETRLTNNAAYDTNPAWSSDGERIAFESHRDDNPYLPAIYVMTADGSGETRLTNAAAEPAWSPDGQRIAFESSRDGTGYPDIYVMNADGSGETRLTDNAAWDAEPAWSPDGRRIAFQSSRDNPYSSPAIYAMNADGSGQTKLTDSAATTWNEEPTWSPDGTRIAFDRGIGTIYLMNADGSGETRLTSRGNPMDYSEPAWSPDGEQIAFTGLRDDNFDIYAMNANGCGQTRLTNTHGDLYPDWQPLPDGTAPPPHPADCPRTLRLSYFKNHEKFRGRLHADASTCVTQQKFSVYEKKKGKDPKLGAAKTDDAGEYSLMQKNAEGKFYSQVKQTSIPGGHCLAAKSKTVKVG